MSRIDIIAMRREKRREHNDMVARNQYAPVEAPDFGPFDLRLGCPVIWHGRVDSWFEHPEAAELRAEIVSTSNTAETCLVLIWNHLYERWNVAAAYKDGNRLPFDYRGL